jgi:hypothetical protein
MSESSMNEFGTNAKSYAQILDAIAAEQIPADLDLAPQILAKIQHGKGTTMQPRMRLVTTVLIVFLALLVLTTVAYAIYRLMGDPGLQSVQDAGLVTDLDVTARPTLLPTHTPASTPRLASNPALSQTLEGVTLTLDWIYLDEGRLAMGMKFTDLPADTALDAPQVTFRNVTPMQAQGYSQSIRSDEHQALYVSYQVIHADAIGGKVSLGVDVPLVQRSGDEQTALATFHFDVEDLPVYSGQAIPIQQTYAVRRNGVEVRLKSVRVMPSTTEIVACYDFPTREAPFWYMQHATVQIGDGPEESYRPYQVLSAIQDDHCVKLGFATGNASGDTGLIFRVYRLVVPLTMQDVVSPERIATANQELAKEGIEIKPAPADQTEGPGGWQFVRKPAPGTDPSKDPSLLVLQALEEKVDGPWEFYVNIPTENIIPGKAGKAAPTPTATPSSLGDRTIGDVTVTLDWAFADAKRVAFGYTITGLPDVPDALYLGGTIDVKDPQGNPFGGGYGGRSEVQRVDGQPGAVTGNWSHVMREPIDQKEINFSIDLTLDGSGTFTANGLDTSAIIGEFPLLPNATPYPPGVFPPALPDRLIGTFHFDVHTSVYPMQVIEPKQAAEANGILIRLERAEITPSYAQFTLCYPKPSAKDWMVGGTPTLKAGAYEAQINSYTLLADADYGGYVGKSPQSTNVPAVAAGERCVQIDFLLGHANPVQSLTLTIPMLEQSVPEVIPDAEMKAAQEKLRADGIEMDYTTSSSAGGGGGGGPIFSKLPEGMDQQEAYQRYLNALGYLYPGPWVFTLDFQP